VIAVLEALSVDGPVGRLAGWAAGQRNERTPVLFLHPVNSAGRIWQGVAGGLDPDRFCLLPDLRGHGASVRRGPFTVEGYMDDVVAVLDATGVDRAHLVGGSLGGAVAVALAAKAPERVASLAAFGSLLSLKVTGEELETIAQTVRNLGTQGFFEDIAPGTMAPGADPGLVEQVVNLATSGGRAPEMVTAVLLNALQSDVSHLAAEVRCPCLVATGEHDAWCTPEVGRAMAEALSTPHRLLAGLGHLPMLEAPDVVASMLNEHFRSSDA
jgi:3-oxoadipate enol-lactonase